MQYSNFDMKNNVHATLSTAISSVATTIQLTAGQGSRFGTTFPQIATLESIENGKVMKREIVKITGRSGDNLTVVRAFAPCPSNDDANSQTQTSISFNADDTISLYIPKEIFDKISDSLNDIYDNGTNNLRTEFVSGLDVEVNAGPVLVGSAYYDFAGGTITLTNNATNYLEIDEDGNLANNTTGRNDENTKLAIITTSGGSVTNIKDRRLGTVGGKIGGVNIHDLTEKQKLDPDDEFIIADSESIYQNKRITAENIFGINFGTGKDGDLHITTSDLNEAGYYIMKSGNYEFNNVTIDSGVTVLFDGEGTVFIKVKGTFTNNGTIDTYGPYITNNIQTIFHSVTVNTYKNTIGNFRYEDLKGGTGGIGSNGLYRGGDGGGKYMNGENSRSGSAAPGQRYLINGGGGGGDTGSTQNATSTSGGNGCDASTSTHGAGGGGFGRINGGNGGNGTTSNCAGGDGGDCYLGTGGNGGNSYNNLPGGNGGNSIYGTGGNGGGDLTNNGMSGHGGNSIYGTGGNGGDGTNHYGQSPIDGAGGYGKNGGNGGNNNTTYHGQGGKGGDAINGHYGLIISANILINNIILANGGNGGNGGIGSTYAGRGIGGNGGNGARGGDVALFYHASITQGTVNVSGGTGGTGGSGGTSGTNGQNGQNGVLTVVQI